MKATVTWQNNMVFIGRSASGFPVQMDADLSFGGMESGVRPMEMIALGLAGVKALLVVFFFMHLWWDSKFNQLVLVTAIVFLVLLISFTIVDSGQYQPTIEPADAYRQELVAGDAG